MSGETTVDVGERDRVGVVAVVAVVNTQWRSQRRCMKLGMARWR